MKSRETSGMTISEVTREFAKSISDTDPEFSAIMSEISTDPECIYNIRMGLTRTDPKFIAALGFINTHLQSVLKKEDYEMISDRLIEKAPEFYLASNDIEEFYNMYKLTSVTMIGETLLLRETPNFFDSWECRKLKGAKKAIAIGQKCTQVGFDYLRRTGQL